MFWSSKSKLTTSAFSSLDGRFVRPVGIVDIDQEANLGVVSPMRVVGELGLRLFGQFWSLKNKSFALIFLSKKFPNRLSGYALIKELNKMIVFDIWVFSDRI